MIARRRALWTLLAAKLVGGWGVGWDIRWHLVIGRDSFWIAPHVMTYASVVVACAVSFGVLAVETWRARRAAPSTGTVTIAGLRGTRGFHLAWWGMAIVILAAPIDDLWHRLFGLDVTLWSPPHLLGPMIEVLSGQGLEEMGINLKDMLSNVMPTRTKRRKVTVVEAKRLLAQEEAQKLIDMDEVVTQAIRRAENSGIVFLDELDKVAGREGGHGPDVSRQGVQRDLLPIVEGSSVTTKHGVVRTDHILFIAAGAFHVAKPSDLIPELQGRFPIRVELDPLTRDDFVRILTEPRNALVTQYEELLKTEQVVLRFTPEAVEAIAETAMQVNASTENIGARRLYTVMEKLLEEISFNAPAMPGKELTIDARYVHDRLAEITRDQDLSRFIL